MTYLTNHNIFCKLEVHWLNSVHIHVLLGPHNVFEELELLASTPSLHTHRIWFLICCDTVGQHWAPLCWGPPLPVHSQNSRSHSCLSLWPLNDTPCLNRIKLLSSASQSLAMCHLHIRWEKSPQSPKAKKWIWKVMDQRQEAKRKPWVQMTRTFHFLKRDEDLVLLYFIG